MQWVLIKRFFLFITIIIFCSLISCFDITDIEENPIGYNWEVSSPNEFGLNDTLLKLAFNEASQTDLSTTFMLDGIEIQEKILSSP